MPRLARQTRRTLSESAARERQKKERNRRTRSNSHHKSSKVTIALGSIRHLCDIEHADFPCTQRPRFVSARSVILELKLPGVKRSQFNHERQLFHQIGWRRQKWEHRDRSCD